MMADAVLIQASRGGIVDEEALAAALNAGALGGAAIDVYSSEPPSPDNPLLKLSGEAAERTLLTPHIAGVTDESNSRVGAVIADAVLAALQEKRT